MKYILIPLVILLIVVGIWNYISVKKYCKKHEMERLEEHEKYIISRAIFIVASGILCGVLGIVLQFVK